MLDDVDPHALRDEGAEPGQHLVEAGVRGQGLQRLRPTALVRADAGLRDGLVVELLLHAELVGGQLLDIDLLREQTW